MFLTPNLTRTQHAVLEGALSRMTGLLSAPAIYMEADRIAGAYVAEQWKEHPSAAATIEALASGHRAPPILIGFIVGLAFGVRLGRRFIRHVKRRQVPIGEAYAGLSEEDRADVRKLIRTLAKGDAAMYWIGAKGPQPTKSQKRQQIESDLEAARRWTREMGRAARKVR